MSMSPPYWQLEREYYTLANPHDLIVRVITYETSTSTITTEDGTTREIQSRAANKVHEFKCKRAVLASNSRYLYTILSPDCLGNMITDTIDLHENEAGSLEVWLKLLHACDMHSTLTNVNLKGLWDILDTAYRYNFDPKSPGAKAWFEAWYYEHQEKGDGKYFNYIDYQALLYPCHIFGFAEGFQWATRYLAYRSSGQVEEKKPEGVQGEHLVIDERVMQQLNTAKSRLKLVLHRSLYNPIDRLLRRSKCTCKVHVLYAYESALVKTGIWPLEASSQNTSVHDTMQKLYHFPGKDFTLPKMCQDCATDFSAVVQKAVTDCRTYFDGLCLDCLTLSDPLLPTSKQLYWQRTAYKNHWDSGCRIQHRQPSWYASFLGPKGEMAEYLRSVRNGEAATQTQGGRKKGKGGWSGDDLGVAE